MASTTAPDLTLYGGVPSRAGVVHWMLEEIGAPYKFEVVDLKGGAQKRPEFLALNPMGKVPVLSHKGVLISETAAICTYLADAFPEAGLAPAIGDADRGPYLKWMFFGPSCIEPPMLEKLLGREPAQGGALGWGSYDQVMDTVANAVSGGKYLVGGRFSAADVLIGSALGWGIMMKAIPERPEFISYLALARERPAFQRYRASMAKMMSEQAASV